MQSTCILDNSFWLLQSLEMSETGGREISWVAFPVIWVRDHFLLPEYLSNSGIKQV